MHAYTSNSGQGFDSSWPAPQPPSYATPLVLFLSSQRRRVDRPRSKWRSVARQVWQGNGTFTKVGSKTVGSLAVWQSTQSRHNLLRRIGSRLRWLHRPPAVLGNVVPVCARIRSSRLRCWWNRRLRLWTGRGPTGPRRVRDVPGGGE